MPEARSGVGGGGFSDNGRRFRCSGYGCQGLRRRRVRADGHPRLFRRGGIGYSSPTLLSSSCDFQSYRESFGPANKGASIVLYELLFFTFASFCKMRIGKTSLFPTIADTFERLGR